MYTAYTVNIQYKIYLMNTKISQSFLNIYDSTVLLK